MSAPAASLAHNINKVLSKKRGAPTYSAPVSHAAMTVNRKPPSRTTQPTQAQTHPAAAIAATALHRHSAQSTLSPEAWSTRQATP